MTADDWAKLQERCSTQEVKRGATLTSRERDILIWVGRGFSAPEIGPILGISPKTVDTYKMRIETKLGLKHRSHYVRAARELGFLENGAEWIAKEPVAEAAD